MIEPNNYLEINSESNLIAITRTSRFSHDDDTFYPDREYPKLSKRELCLIPS